MYHIPTSQALISDIENSIQRCTSKVDFYQSILDGKKESKLKKADLVEMINNYRGQLLAYQDSLAMVKAYLSNGQEDSSQDVTEAIEPTTEYVFNKDDYFLPLHTRFNYCQSKFPELDEDELTFMKFDDGFHAVEAVKTRTGRVTTIKDTYTQKYHKIKDLPYQYFYGDPIETISPVEESKPEKFTARLSTDAMDRPQLEITANFESGGNQSIKMLMTEINVTDLDSLINQLQQIRNEHLMSS